MPNLYADTPLPIRFRRGDDVVAQLVLSPDDVERLTAVATLAGGYTIRGTRTDLWLKPIAVIPHRGEDDEIVGYDVPVE